MNDINRVRRTVRNVVSHQLAPAKIIDVELTEDVDHDGDPILRVRVIFEAKDDSLGAKNVLGLARHLREPLELLGETASPVFSFMTSKEFAGEAA